MLEPNLRLRDGLSHPKGEEWENGGLLQYTPTGVGKSNLPVGTPTDLPYLRRARRTSATAAPATTRMATPPKTK